jgi:P27 family predicted phage terminase small subunit
MAGRTPKPTALKLLQGNPGRRPINESEPKPEAGVPAMPDYLDAAAQAEWDRLIPILTKMRVLTVADGAELALYCQTHSRLLEAEEEITRLGVTLEEAITRDRGDGSDPKVIGYKYKKNPAVTVRTECIKMLRAFLSDFGLSPAARTRVHAAPTDDNSQRDDMDSVLGDESPE